MESQYVNLLQMSQGKSYDEVLKDEGRSKQSLKRKKCKKRYEEESSPGTSDESLEDHYSNEDPDNREDAEDFQNFIQ